MKPHDKLKALVSIPSVSAVPEHLKDCRHLAETLREDLKSLGFKQTELLGSKDSPPVLLASFSDSEDSTKKTLLVYMHYDVQPASLDDGWSSNPFRCVERDRKIYGRGVADSKCNIVSFLNGFEIFSKNLNGELPFNLKVVIEGQEETGSPVLEGLIKSDPELFKADYLWVSDCTVLDDDKPSLLGGLRGLLAFEISLKCLPFDVHSGAFGGAIPNAGQVLIELLSGVKGLDNRIKIPGFYEGVVEANEETKVFLENTNSELESYIKDFMPGVPSVGECNFSVHERLGIRPTFEINGLTCGYQGEGMKSAIPSTASAKVTCRLVDGQSHQAVMACIKAYFTEKLPNGASLDFQIQAASNAVRINTDSKLFAAAKHAMSEAWGQEVLIEMGGSSVPIIKDFSEIVPEVCVMGFGHRGCRAHGVDEHIYLSCLERGVLAVERFLGELYLEKG